MAKKAVVKPESKPTAVPAAPGAVATEEAPVEETQEETKELIVTQGIGGQLWEESKFVPILKPEMELSVRKETCRQILRQAAHIDDNLNLVSGEVLYEVRENGYWKDWKFTDDVTGEERTFKDFEEYAQVELGMAKRKAYYLSKIYQRFVVEFELDKESLKGLEWSKAKIIEPIATKDNVKDLLDKTKGMSKRAIEEYVKSLKAAEAGGDATSTTSAASEEFEKMTFKLTPAQKENVDTALKIAEQFTGSDKAGNQLDLICSDYIAGSAGTGLEGALGNLKQAMTSLSRAYGVELEIKSIVDEKRYNKLAGTEVEAEDTAPAEEPAAATA